MLYFTVHVDTRSLLLSHTASFLSRSSIFFLSHRFPRNMYIIYIFDILHLFVNTRARQNCPKRYNQTESRGIFFYFKIVTSLRIPFINFNNFFFKYSIS